MTHQCSIFVQEDCANSGEILNKFLKYPGVKVTIGSNLVMNLENLQHLKTKYSDCKFVKTYRFSGSNDRTCDFFIFKETDYDRAKALSQHPLTIRQNKIVIVLLLERESVSETHFKVVSWQFVSEYVRQFLKLPEKVEKLKKEKKQKEPPAEEKPFEYKDIHSPFEDEQLEEPPDDLEEERPF